MQGQEHQDGLPSPRRYAAVVAMSLGAAISSVDNGFVNIALPTMASELGVDPAATVLIVTIFQLMVMTTVLPLASLGDRIGRRGAVVEMVDVRPPSVPGHPAHFEPI